MLFFKEQLWISSWVQEGILVGDRPSHPSEDDNDGDKGNNDKDDNDNGSSHGGMLICYWLQHALVSVKDGDQVMAQLLTYHLNSECTGVQCVYYSETCLRCQPL